MVEREAREVCRGLCSAVSFRQCSNVWTFGLDPIAMGFKEWDEVLIVYAM